jgi:hypothetical protein
MNIKEVEKFQCDYYSIEETTLLIIERAKIAIEFYKDLAKSVGLRKRTWKSSSITKIGSVLKNEIVFEWEEYRRGGYTYHIDIMALGEDTYKDYITDMVDKEKEHEVSYDEFMDREQKRIEEYEARKLYESLKKRFGD